ncbi:MAG: hypothetical protein K2V38_12545, partial [Gemmataceae bacterium]|nr:hypothetical protein [Gemmataceae bacterium]
MPAVTLAFSADATTLYAVGRYSTGVHACHLAERVWRPVSVAGERPCFAFELHPGGRWAFSFSRSNTYLPFLLPHLIDLHAGTLQPFTAQLYGPDSLAIAPGGAWVVSIVNAAFDPAPLGGPTTPGERLCGWTMTPDGPVHAWHRDRAS